MALLTSVLAWLGGVSVLYALLWGSLLVSTVAMLLIMRSDWGRRRPTHRYVMLSVVAHLLLICLATTIRFASLPAGNGPAPVKVRIVMRSPETAPPVDAAPEPARQQPEESPPTPEARATDRAAAEQPRRIEWTPERPAPKPPRPEAVETSPPAIDAAPITPVPANPAPASPAPATPAPAITESAISEPAIAEPPAPTTMPIPPPVPPSSHDTQPAPIEPAAPTAPLRAATQAVEQPSQPTTEPVSLEPAPTAFDAREGEERVRRVMEEGGDSYTEDAVAAALAWLATAQSPDGRWDADRWSAGRERGAVLGQSRVGVGLKADTAVTGLALLAIMGAGHDHLHGPFADVTRDGLAYLIRTQAADGNLFGEASLYAQTYCHSMATFALAEALAKTNDERLRPAVTRAARFLIDRQDRSSGGWRYRPGYPGDMSQHGWITMALRSSELAGVDVPPDVWDGVERFVAATQSGQHGGLASYLPNSAPSRSMTAESLYCRQILGQLIPGAASGQALDYLSQELPGAGTANYYSWYYTTLALHHHRRSSAAAEFAWRDWNEALKRTLLSTQVAEGANKGSWSPNSVWGGCGGRVYTTALAAMCMEVYYRYDPSQLVRDPWLAARPGPGTLR